MVDDHERVSIYGRIFQKASVDERIYCAPVADDDIEEDRLAAQHGLISRLLGNSLISPAIRLGEPSRALDCGYGGGDWSVEFAEEFEDCEVTGMDVYPMELPVHQPDNLNLVAYNMNDRLNDPEVFQSKAYDLIHSRCVAPGIKKNRWPSYFRDMRVLLRPGGWVQAAEYHLHVQSNCGALTSESAVYRWWLSYAQAMGAMNRDARVGPRLQELMSAAGLRDVQQHYIRVPIGDWDPNPVQSSIGHEAVSIVGDMLESLGLWPFTAQLGWSFAAFTQLMQEVRAELQNKDLKLYIPIHIVVGRR